MLPTDLRGRGSSCNFVAWGPLMAPPHRAERGWSGRRGSVGAKSIAIRVAIATMPDEGVKSRQLLSPDSTTGQRSCLWFACQAVSQHRLNPRCEAVPPGLRGEIYLRRIERLWSQHGVEGATATAEGARTDGFGQRRFRGAGDALRAAWGHLVRRLHVAAYREGDQVAGVQRDSGMSPGLCWVHLSYSISAESVRTPQNRLFLEQGAQRMIPSDRGRDFIATGLVVLASAAECGPDPGRQVQLGTQRVHSGGSTGQRVNGSTRNELVESGATCTLWSKPKS